MNESNKQLPDEKQLWQQFSAQDQTQPISSTLDPNLLAAYLDGQADPTQVEQIESLLASNPVLLDELIELRQLQDVNPALVSRSVLDQAQALAATPYSAPKARSWHHFQWAAAAAAVVLACLGGYSVGQTTFQDQLTAEASLSSQASLELDEMTVTDILQPNGSNGDEE